VQLGIHVANALDIEIPATTVTAGVMYGALNQGLGELDYAALYKVYEPHLKRQTSLPPTASTIEDRERGDEEKRPAESSKAAEIPRVADVLTPLGEPSKHARIAQPGAKSSPPSVVAPVIAELSKSGETKPAPAAGTRSEDAKSATAAEGSSAQPATTELVSESADTSAAKPITGIETKTGANGEEENVSPRPFNFVRRWFVSRGS